MLTCQLFKGEIVDLAQQSQLVSMQMSSERALPACQCAANAHSSMWLVSAYVQGTDLNGSHLRDLLCSQDDIWIRHGLGLIEYPPDFPPPAKNMPMAKLSKLGSAICPCCGMLSAHMASTQAAQTHEQWL